MDCSLPGSSVHGISQARRLERAAMSFSRGSPWPREWTCVSCISRWILYHQATRETPVLYVGDRISFTQNVWSISLCWGPATCQALYIISSHSVRQVLCSFHRQGMGSSTRAAPRPGSSRSRRGTSPTCPSCRTSPPLLLQGSVLRGWVCPNEVDIISLLVGEPW